MEDIPNGLLYLLGAIAFPISLYFLIKLAVRSALIEVEEKKLDYMRREKEHLSKMLDERTISPDEYYQRIIQIPLVIAYPKKQKRTKK